jgi:iron complex transport system substrate-binding protein
MKIVFFIFFCAFAVFSQKIISLAPPATNQLIALGADSLLVGKTAYCPKIAGNKNTKIIGDVINIGGESIVALNPDIVIAGGLTSKVLIEKLRKTNVNVFVMNDPKNYEELSENFRNIAEIAGVSKKADSILSIVSEKYSQIKEQNKTLKIRPKIFIQLSVNPIYTIMKNTLGNEMIEAAGALNAFNLTSGAVVGGEAIVAANPDVIIIADMENLSKNEVEKWAKFKNISAVKNNAIYVFDGYEIGSATPVSFIETVEKIIALKYKE